MNSLMNQFAALAAVLLLVSGHRAEETTAKSRDHLVTQKRYENRHCAHAVARESVHAAATALLEARLVAEFVATSLAGFSIARAWFEVAAAFADAARTCVA